MKKKVLSALILLISLFICWSCGQKETVDENKDLQIFKTDLQLTQEQKLSQIKANKLLENKGYLPNDELVILINLKGNPLIETYNNEYSTKVSSVSEYASSVKGQSQVKKIKAEQK